MIINEYNNNTINQFKRQQVESVINQLDCYTFTQLVNNYLLNNPCTSSLHTCDDLWRQYLSTGCKYIELDGIKFTKSAIIDNIEKGYFSWCQNYAWVDDGILTSRLTLNYFKEIIIDDIMESMSFHSLIEEYISKL